jgi:hypothetical protein
MLPSPWAGRHGGLVCSLNAVGHLQKTWTPSEKWLIFLVPNPLPGDNLAGLFCPTISSFYFGNEAIHYLDCIDVEPVQLYSMSIRPINLLL